MDLSAIVNTALILIQQNAAAIGQAADIVTLSTAAGNVLVKAVKKGSQLVAFFIGQKKAEQTVEDGTPSFDKSDVAILVDINRRMLRDVARYLEANDIDADMVVVTNDPEYGDRVKFLAPDEPADWAQLVREFSATMNAVKHEIGGARIHLFLSTPLPLAFGLGAVWGTVDEATVYHWEKQDYHPVMKISRELRT
jgi:hypothetical protein